MVAMVTITNWVGGIQNSVQRHTIKKRSKGVRCDLGHMRVPIDITERNGDVARCETEQNKTKNID